MHAVNLKCLGLLFSLLTKQSTNRYTGKRVMHVSLAAMLFNTSGQIALTSVAVGKFYKINAIFNTRRRGRPKKRWSYR